jgi:ubiquinone/menaquinone biosynthesis C-methylase UbiE
MSPSDHVDRIREQFTRQADAYADTEQARDERAMAALVGLCGADAEDRVLDVACGPGVLTRAFADVCSEVVGCDVTQALLDKARAGAARRGLANASFQQGDATALPFKDDSFSLASCRAAFHHFPEPERVLSEMVRVVRPGGRLLIADMLTSAEPAAAEAHNALERLCDPTHVNALPLATFERLFGEAGLRVERCIRSEMHYSLEEWIAHGGPDEVDAGGIRARMARWADEDAAGLKVRREDDALWFTHQVAVFVLALPAAA